MTNYKRYSEAVVKYDAAVGRLKDNLHYMIEREMSPSLIKMQELIIFSLEKFKTHTQSYIHDLETENHQLARRKVDEIERLRNEKESLEAICIIHGIMDFPCWMAKGNRYLVNEAVQFYHSNELQLPEKLLTYFQSLPNHEQTVLDQILYKTFYENQARLQQEINAIKKKLHGENNEAT